jgi:hypothetical protein
MVGRLISETLWGKKANGPTALDPYRRFAPSPLRGVLRLRAGRVRVPLEGSAAALRSG